MQYVIQQVRVAQSLVKMAGLVQILENLDSDVNAHKTIVERHAQWVSAIIRGKK